MNERNAKLTFENRIVCFLLTMLLIVSVFIVDLQTVRSASAAVILYSNVLDDLKKDEKFLESDYPYKAGDRSIAVVDIAESSNREVFVYVYNPGGNVIASSIVLSLKEANDLDPSLYSLILLNCNENKTLQKYKIKNLTVSESKERYYFIVSILRKYEEKYDNAPPSGQTTSEVPFEVGQEHKFVDKDGNLIHTREIKEVLKITDKYVGFFRYKTYKYLQSTGLDSHFVAFDTNWVIDDLLEVKLSYEISRYSYWHNGAWETQNGYSETELVEDIICKEDVGGGELTNFWFQPYKYEWPRIQKFEDFVKDLDSSFEVWCGVIFNKTQSIQVSDEELLAQTENGDYKYKWILRFYDSDYIDEASADIFGYMNGRHKAQTRVSNVVLLRMYFKSDGKYYNLGVVDNKQTGSATPSGTTTPAQVGLNDRTKDILKLIEVIFKILLGLIILIGLFAVLSPFLPYISKFFVFIIMLPIKLVKGLISMFKKEKNSSESNSEGNNR